MILALPALAAVERVPPSPLHEVASAIEIDAPPERVWPHVVGFAEPPPPSEWFFRLGIAYPRRARLEGQGAGAVRYCGFSTGAFVEPITVWDEPRRLAFDVVAQPPPPCTSAARTATCIRLTSTATRAASAASSA